MPPLAPIVLRTGHVVAHINDPTILDQDLRSFADAAPGGTQREGEHTTASLIAYEEAIAEVRRHSERGGRDGQALLQAQRNAARSRGAVAHPDTSLAQSIREALGRWSPRDLCDDRVLRSHDVPAATRAAPERCGKSQAVKRPTDAAPSGGPDALERRMDAMERQLAQVLEAQVNQGIYVRSVFDSRFKVFDAHLGYLSTRTSQIADDVAKCIRAEAGMAAFAQSVTERLKALEDEGWDEEATESDAASDDDATLGPFLAEMKRTVKHAEMVADMLERSYEGVSRRLHYRADKAEATISEFRTEIDELASDAEARSAEVVELLAHIRNIDARLVPPQSPAEPGASAVASSERAAAHCSSAVGASPTEMGASAVASSERAAAHSLLGTGGESPTEMGALAVASSERAAAGSLMGVGGTSPMILGALAVASSERAAASAEAGAAASAVKALDKTTCTHISAPFDAIVHVVHVVSVPPPSSFRGTAIAGASAFAPRSDYGGRSEHLGEGGRDPPAESRRATSCPHGGRGHECTKNRRCEDSGLAPDGDRDREGQPRQSGRGRGRRSPECGECDGAPGPAADSAMCGRAARGTTARTLPLQQLDGRELLLGGVAPQPQPSEASAPAAEEGQAVYVGGATTREGGGRPSDQGS